MMSYAVHEMNDKSMVLCIVLQSLPVCLGTDKCIKNVTKNGPFPMKSLFYVLLCAKTLRATDLNKLICIFNTDVFSPPPIY